MDATQKKVLFGCLGCGVLVMLITLAGCIGCGALLITAPEGGVRMGNEMDAYAVRYIDEHELLEPGEEVVAYYDATLEMSGKEAAILTDRRVMYHKNGRTDAIFLDQITRLRHTQDGLTGDVITVQAGRKRMKIEIAVLNNGDVFWDTLVSMIDPKRVEVEDEVGGNLEETGEEAVYDESASEDAGPPELPPDLSN